MILHARRFCLAGLRFRAQTFALSAALLLGWLSAPDAFAAAKLPEVSAPPAELGVPAFYRKFISTGGYPIVASERVNDYALKEAMFLVNQMLAQRPDVRAAMIQSGSRLCILAHDEFTTDQPEFARLGRKPVPEFPQLDPMEYFAETTEAFFSRNDFFPFTRVELKKHDPEMEQLLGKLWGATK